MNTYAFDVLVLYYTHGVIRAKRASPPLGVWQCFGAGGENAARISARQARAVPARGRRKYLHVGLTTALHAADTPGRHYPDPENALDGLHPGPRYRKDCYGRSIRTG